MKETISFPAQAGTLQSAIDWKRVIRTATHIAGRTVLTVIRHKNTPWVLTAIPGFLVWLGLVLENDALYEWSVVATAMPLAWALYRELKTSNPDEL